MALSEIIFKGTLNNKSHILQSFTLSALSMLGSQCFEEEEANQVYLSRFDSDKCVYGNSEIKINFKDFS